MQFLKHWFPSFPPPPTFLSLSHSPFLSAPLIAEHRVDLQVISLSALEHTKSVELKPQGEKSRKLLLIEFLDGIFVHKRPKQILKKRTESTEAKSYSPFLSSFFLPLLIPQCRSPRSSTSRQLDRPPRMLTHDP